MSVQTDKDDNCYIGGDLILSGENKTVRDGEGNDLLGAIQDQITEAVVGLYDDRGNFDASDDEFPSDGGSGEDDAILKGDIWTVSVAGTLGGTAVEPGDTVRALVDDPQDAEDWAINKATGGAGNDDEVLEYVATLTQTGTDAPLASIHKNTLSDDVVWTRDSAGNYFGTLTGAFPLGRVALFTGNNVFLNGSDVFLFARLYRESDNAVGLHTMTPEAAMVDIDSVSHSIDIRILVYPA